MYNTTSTFGKCNDSRYRLSGIGIFRKLLVGKSPVPCGTNGESTRFPAVILAAGAVTQLAQKPVANARVIPLNTLSGDE